VALLCLAGLLAGCGGGSGWVRIEPETSQPAVATQTFDEVEAVSAGTVDRDRVNRPILLTAESEQEGPNGRVIRSWKLLALATPIDGNRRVRIFALVGQSTLGRPLRWQLYTSKDANFGGSAEGTEGRPEGLANWRYDGWLMIYGPVAPADIRDSNGSVRRLFSASLKPRTSSDSFHEQAQTMLDTLKKLRSPPPLPSPTTQRSIEHQPAPPAEAVEYFDDAIGTLQRSVAKTQPDGRKDAGTPGRRDARTKPDH
jgi:hypothetical protein